MQVLPAAVGLGENLELSLGTGSRKVHYHVCFFSIQIILIYGVFLSISPIDFIFDPVHGNTSYRSERLNGIVDIPIQYIPPSSISLLRSAVTLEPSDNDAYLISWYGKDEIQNTRLSLQEGYH